MYTLHIHCVIVGCFVALYVTESTGLVPETRYGVFKKNETFSGMVANAGLLSKMNISSRSICGNLCLLHWTCAAFFHNTENGTCSLHDHSFRNVAPTPSPGTTLYELKTEVSCASAGFQVISTYCIKIVVTSVTGSAAKQGCASLYPGSALVKITSMAKQSIIENELGSISGLEIVYIQGIRHYEGLTLKWLYDDGSELVYFNWNIAGSQPKIEDNAQIYIGMRKSAAWRWHDFEEIEIESGSYICELDLN